MENTNVIPFTHNIFGNVRAIEAAGKILFCGKDIAVALGYANTSKALNDHCKSGVTNRYPIVDALGRTQEAVFITEPDVIRLIVSSKLPKAQEFEKWIFEEVVPTVLKHGGYLTPAKIEEALLNPDTIINLATQLKAEREKTLQLEAKIEADLPKTIFADAVTVAHTSILVGDLAKLITQNGVSIGQDQLFNWLRANGYLISRKGESWNMPTQKSMDRGLFEVKESTVAQPDGSVRINKTTKVTGRGQIYFINKFLNIGGEAA